jgi:hypothetical protein
MLVEHSQDPHYQDGVVVYGYICGQADGPSDGGEFYHRWTSEEVKAELERAYGYSPSGWITVPDQVTGCRDDWVAAVPIDSPRSPEARG